MMVSWVLMSFREPMIAVAWAGMGFSAVSIDVRVPLMWLTCCGSGLTSPLIPVTLPVVTARELLIESRAEMMPSRNPITTRTTRTPIETQTFSHRLALIAGDAMSGAYAAGRCAIGQFSFFSLTRLPV